VLADCQSYLFQLLELSETNCARLRCFSFLVVLSIRALLSLHIYYSLYLSFPQSLLLDFFHLSIYYLLVYHSALQLLMKTLKSLLLLDLQHYFLLLLDNSLILFLLLNNKLPMRLLNLKKLSLGVHSRKFFFLNSSFPLFDFWRWSKHVPS